MSFEVPDALPTAFEKPKDRFIRTLDLTHNCTRSPRLAASGPQNKVGEGSLQNRSVTSGKGLALRVGFRGSCQKKGAARKLLDASRCRVDSRLVTVDGPGMLLEAFPVRRTINSELKRTRGIQLFN